MPEVAEAEQMVEEQPLEETEEMVAVVTDPHPQLMVLIILAVVEVEAITVEVDNQQKLVEVV